MIRKEADSIKRWKEYFEKLLDEENERLVRGDGYLNLGVVTEILKKSGWH